MANRYEDLVVWQKAMQLAKEVYLLSKTFPQDERFGLTTQLRRAAVSVASNIAEGQGRTTKGKFRQFLGNAGGSLFEVETQLKLAVALGYLDEKASAEVFGLSGGVARLLNRLIASMQNRA